MTHLKAKTNGNIVFEGGIDLANYIESDEWDILKLSAQLNTVPYDGVNDDFYPSRTYFIL